MSLATDTREQLGLVVEDALTEVTSFAASLSGSPVQQRTETFGFLPPLISDYADATAVLAVDYYDEERALAGVVSSFNSSMVVNVDADRLERSLLWATGTLFDDEPDLTVLTSRFIEVVQSEISNPFRDTIVSNRRRDPEAVGWRRIASGNGCKFCQMLAGRGAVYRHDTARFAAHPNCTCTAQPVFGAGDVGEEASPLQYLASGRRRTAEQRRMLRAHLNGFFEEYPG